MLEWWPKTGHPFNSDDIRKFTKGLIVSAVEILTAVYGYDKKGAPRIPKKLIIPAWLHLNEEYKRKYQPMNFPVKPIDRAEGDTLTGPLVFYAFEFSK